MDHVILHALLDTLKLFPFLLLAYILIELLEQKTDLSKPHGGLSGKLGPLVGSATGIIPQCGFSVMAAKLYEHRHVTLGTLLAVFIATSDEAFIIMLTSGEGAIYIMPMIVVKVLVGTAVGYLVDVIARKEAIPVVSCEHAHAEYHSCGREHHGKSAWKVYFFSPLLHSLQVAAFILIVNFAFETLFFLVGEESVMAFLQSGYWFQPLISALIGLIPNCASSVVLTETYLLGGISFGSCLAGLCTNAGLGLFVLFKNVKQWKRNLLLVILMYAVGIAVGYAVNALALLFV